MRSYGWGLMDELLPYEPSCGGPLACRGEKAVIVVMLGPAGCGETSLTAAFGSYILAGIKGRDGIRPGENGLRGSF